MMRFHAHPSRANQFARATLVAIATSLAASPVPVAADEVAAAAEAKPPSRIYLTVFLRKDNTFENAIIAVDPATGQWQRIGDGNLVFGLRVSPDKQSLLFAVHEDGIWKCAPQEGSERTRVMYRGSSPLWSPDGKQLISGEGAYEEGQGWKHSTWRSNLDGTALTRLPIPDTDGVEDWSPDGNWVVTVSDRHPPHGSGYQLYVMRPDGTEQRRLTKDGLNVYSRFSPDSRSIVYVHQDKEGNSLRVVNIDGRDAREILKAEGAGGAGACGAACWSPDGKQLALHRYDWEIDENGRKLKRAGNDHHDRIEIVDVEGGNIRRITLASLQPLDIGRPEWR
jgi:WD40 repeat protein